MYGIKKSSAIYRTARLIKRIYKKTCENIIYIFFAIVIIPLSFFSQFHFKFNNRRILLIPQFSNTGGTRTYFETLMRFLFSQGYQTIVAIDTERIDTGVKQLCTTLGARVVPIENIPRWLDHRRRSRYMNIFYDLLVVLKLVRISKPDFIVASIGTPGDYLGMLLLPYRMLYILHTMPTAALDPPMALVVQSALSRGKELLTVSKFARDRIMENWIHDKRHIDRVKYIYNTTFTPEVNDYLNLSPIKTVLTIGHLEEYKNPKLWIRIAKTVIQKFVSGTIRFIWLGPGSLYNECIESLTNDERINIIFAGYSSDPQKYLREATVYFQPSLFESHGIAVVEAMSNGVPCVVSRVGGLPESVIDGYNGYLVDINDEEDIVCKIQRLLNDDDLRLKMGEYSRELFQEHFSMEKWYEKMRAEFDMI